MEYLIKEAFLHVDVYGPHVANGEYDLLGPHDEIIMKHVWETMIQPGWEISMHMWPIPEPPEDPLPGLGDIVIVDEGAPPPLKYHSHRWPSTPLMVRRCGYEFTIIVFSDCE